MRKIYEHLTIAEKKEVIQNLKEDLVKLEEELTQESFSSFVRDILYTTRDKWNLEIDEIELDIKHNE